MNEIILDNITKKYNGKVILDKVSEKFAPGSSIAFMGHNGCGKSTLLKIIAGLVAPTSGRVLCPKPLLFHYVPEKFMPTPLTARVYLKRMGELDGMKKEVIAERIEELGNDFFLTELLDIPMKSLSKGTLQKIGVIQTLMKTPEVLLLDEPLSGQDESSQRVFIQKTNQLREQGVTIFMSCHEQSLVDAIAEKTYTIQNGIFADYQPETEKKQILIFYNVNGQIPTEQMERFGKGYKLSVKESEAQQVILELMKNGWQLRGMYDEKNN